MRAYRPEVLGLRPPSIGFVVLYAITQAIYILVNNFNIMLYVFMFNCFREK